MSSPNPPRIETDKDAADLLLRNHSKEIRYATDSQTWYFWDGFKWIRDTEALHAANMWSNLADTRVPKNIMSANGNSVRNPFRNYALSNRGTEQIIKTARRDPRLHIKQADLDSRAYELNTPDGIVNLTTGELEPPNADNLHTKMTSSVPSTETPHRWLALLDRIFDNDQSLIDYMQTLMGLACIGEVLEQIMPFAHGPGGTGKSTFFGTIEKLLGDYAAPVRSSLLMRRSSEHLEQIASLQGVRMGVMSELNQGERFDEAKLKYLTGNDTISARHMRAESFYFKPSHTLFLFGNAKPYVAEGGDAFYRRVRFIPFRVSVHGNKEEIKAYQNYLIRQEGPQILNWLVQGAAKYLEIGLITPPIIETMTKEYEYDEDYLAQFIDERCVVGDEHKVLYSDFRIEFEAWCSGQGITFPHNSRVLTEKLKSNRKYGNINNKYRTKNGRYLTGIALLDSDTPISNAGIKITNTRSG